MAILWADVSGEEHDRDNRKREKATEGQIEKTDVYGVKAAKV